jgi:hypothetical protein
LRRGSIKTGRGERLLKGAKPIGKSVRHSTDVHRSHWRGRFPARSYRTGGLQSVATASSPPDEAVFEKALACIQEVSHRPALD